MYMYMHMYMDIYYINIYPYIMGGVPEKNLMWAQRNETRQNSETEDPPPKSKHPPPQLYATFFAHLKYSHARKTYFWSPGHTPHEPNFMSMCACLLLVIHHIVMHDHLLQ